MVHTLTNGTLLFIPIFVFTCQVKILVTGNAKYMPVPVFVFSEVPLFLRAFYCPAAFFVYAQRAIIVFYYRRIQPVQAQFFKCKSHYSHNGVHSVAFTSCSLIPYG